MTDWRDTVRNDACTLCPLNESAAHVCLLGSGPPQAKIMILGEAPGAVEDGAGRPFTGPSGQLLDDMLQEVGIDRDECYVSNVAKCRPPENRQPENAEVKTCVQAYLGEELENVRPEFILLLGNAALRGVTGKSGITKHKGTMYEARGTKIFATFHPAAVLRNPRYKHEVRADLQRFARLVRGEASPTPKTTVRIIRTKDHLRWLCEEIVGAEELAYDVETYCSHPAGTNLQEYRGDESKIVSISFTWEEGSAAVVPLHHEHTPWKDPDAVGRVLGKALARSPAKTIAHNGLYDARWMAAKGLPVVQTFDTMLAAHMVDENRAKGLKPLSQILLGADAYDVGDDLANAFTMPLKRLCTYNGKDTDYTLRLYHKLKPELVAEDRPARVFAKLMMPASNALVDIERRGIRVDSERWAERFQQASAIEDKLRQYMLQHVPTGKRASINFASPKQVGEWIFGDLGLPVIEHTAKGAPSSKESVLLQLGKEHKAVRAMLKWRKWKKYMTSFFLPWRDFMDVNDRIHPSYKLSGTVTGRLSCTNPNLQQVPRDKFIRGMIGTDPGWTFVQCDLSQVELRIAAMMANERNMLSLFHRGEDIHMILACRITGKIPEQVSKEERKLAKSVAFGYLFSMGAAKYVEYARDSFDLDVTLEESEALRERFFSEFPALRPWHDRQRRLARRYHRVHSPFGRIRHLPDIISGDRAVQGEAERQAINSPVQSCASDLMLTALVELHQTLPQDQARIIGSVHDAILCEVRTDVLDEWAPVIKATMENPRGLKSMFGVELTVPIVAELETGTHWGDVIPWEA